MQCNENTATKKNTHMTFMDHVAQISSSTTMLNNQHRPLLKVMTRAMRASLLMYRSNE